MHVTRDRAGLCQPRVEQLLKRPSSLAQSIQAHHTRTALERVECAAHRGLIGQVGGICRKRTQCGQAALDHRAGLFHKNRRQVFFAVDVRLRRLFHRFGRIGSGRLAHGRAKFSRRLVVDKQLTRQAALVAQHVDQKPHRAYAVSELLEHLAALGQVGRTFGEELLDQVAHAQRGQRWLLQPQDGKHAAHLAQASGHLPQWRGVRGAPKEHVEHRLDLGQGGAQLADHGAHGLALAHAPVQVFHPGFKRFGLTTGTGGSQSLRQGAATLPKKMKVQLVVQGFQVQDCR